MDYDNPQSASGKYHPGTNHRPIIIYISSYTKMFFFAWTFTPKLIIARQKSLQNTGFITSQTNPQRTPSPSPSPSIPISIHPRPYELHPQSARPARASEPWSARWAWCFRGGWALAPRCGRWPAADRPKSCHFLGASLGGFPWELEIVRI